MRNPTIGSPQPTTAPLSPPTAEDLERERACKASTAAWSIRSWRGTARTAGERLEQLRRAGRVHDEAWFARLGQ